MPHVVAAPDKFRGTASAAEIAAAVGEAATTAGWTCDQAPVADGGEGLLDVLRVRGGVIRRTTVTGPLGEPVDAEWLLDGATAIIEMARASGLLLAGGAEGNRPMTASTYGTGELIAAAMASGARRIIVGVGGSATTDGGQGALDALAPVSRLVSIELIVACDVTTRFVEAATDFAPQKGATPAQVALLERRLQRLGQDYRARSGVDVAVLEGAGAAGGLAGGLATIGARLVPGFDLVADLIGLAERIHGADLVVTGEGFLDEWSFRGKTVGGVVELADEEEVDALVVAGEVFGQQPMEAISLVERFGRDRSMAEPAACVREVVGEVLCERSGSH